MSDRMIDHKKQAVVARIKRLEDAINKANEYLESGKHANWNGFRPLFTSKKEMEKYCRRTGIGSKTYYFPAWRWH